jgi:hypothetical protein
MPKLKWTCHLFLVLCTNTTCSFNTTSTVFRFRVNVILINSPYIQPSLLTVMFVLYTAKFTYCHVCLCFFHMGKLSTFCPRQIGIFLHFYLENSLLILYMIVQYNEYLKRRDLVWQIYNKLKFTTYNIFF